MNGKTLVAGAVGTVCAVTALALSAGGAHAPEKTLTMVVTDVPGLEELRRDSGAL
ncbi:MAG: hypothetical protein U5L11_16940 [Arhodomonas sp.]|nr:hypothetical protein [Arhodomonas sp.]